MEPAGDVNDTPPVKRNNSSSLRRAIKVLDVIAAVQEREGKDCTLARLAQEAGVARSTVHRLLAPLIEAGLVAQTSAGYRLGQHTAYLGGIYLDQLDLRATVRKHLESLVEQTGETAHLVLHTGTEMTYLDKVESPRALRMYSRVGGRMPLYCTGAGKAMLAYLPESVVSEVVAKGLTRRTPNTIVSAEHLHRELVEIRQRGYSIDEEENEPGIRCVGAVLFDSGDAPAAAISLTGPVNRMTKNVVPDFGAMVAAEAREVSRTLGCSRYP